MGMKAERFTVELQRDLVALILAIHRQEWDAANDIMQPYVAGDPLTRWRFMKTLALFADQRVRPWPSRPVRTSKNPFPDSALNSRPRPTSTTDTAGDPVGAIA